MASFSAIWKDCGFLAATPPCLVVPYEGLGLVSLNGVRSFDARRDLKYDRTNLTVSVVRPGETMMQLMMYSENFPARSRDQILALSGGLMNQMRFGSTILSIEGAFTGTSAALECTSKSGRAKLDVVTVRRRRVVISFRYIRHRGADGTMSGGTRRDWNEAGKLIEVLNRLFMPSANVELVLRSSKEEKIDRALGPGIGTQSFRQHVAPYRDKNADVTVFFAGQWKGGSDPLGSAFKDLKSVIVDDTPLQYIAPETAWPPHLITDDQIYYSKMDRKPTDRDLHIVLAHEVAHILGVDHNHGDDNLMSMNRQDLKLTKNMVLAVEGR